MFTIWFSANFNIVSFSTGSSGPVFFSLGIKDTLLVLLVVNVMFVSQKFQAALTSLYCSHRSCLVPAYLCVLGNKSCFKNTSFLTHLFFVIFSAVFGPKLGMRSMVQCRFSWGYVQTFFLYNSNS